MTSTNDVVRRSAHVETCVARLPKMTILKGPKCFWLMAHGLFRKTLHSMAGHLWMALLTLRPVKAGSAGCLHQAVLQVELQALKVMQFQPKTWHSKP